MKTHWGDCIRCGREAELGWGHTCQPCWATIPPIDDYAHDDWCKTACPHGFGPIQLAALIDGLDA